MLEIAACGVSSKNFRKSWHHHTAKIFVACNDEDETGIIDDEKIMAKIMSEWWFRDSQTSAPPFLLMELEKCIDRMKSVL